MYNSEFRKLISPLAVLTILFLMAVSLPVFSEGEEATTEEGNDAKIKWVETVEEATKLSTETDKPIMMDFYTDW